MRRAPFAWLLAAVVAGSALTTSRGQELDETTRSAVYLLRMSMNYNKDGRHLRMQRALRQLHDPELAPLFSELVESDRPRLKIHGMLGLAEIDENHQIDMIRLIELDNPTLQRMVVTAAMDLKLMNVAQARQLMQSPGLERQVRLVVATYLMRHDEPTDLDFLRESAQSDALRTASFAALLLLQVGEASAIEQLRALDASDHKLRDRLRVDLLRTAFGSKFDAVVDWALAMSTEAQNDAALRRMALLVALRFGAPEAPDMWRQQYHSATEPVDRKKLAMVALNASHWVDPSLFDSLIDSEHDDIGAIGRTGAAVAGRTGIVEAVLNVIDLKQSQVNDWALDYAKELAEPSDAQTILLGLIFAFDGPDRQLANRLQHAIVATTLLADRYPDNAPKLLRPIFADEKTDVRLLRGMLIGLAQCKQTDPYAIIEGLPPFADPQSRSLALLLAAKYGHELTDKQLHDLALMVRGGGQLQRHLRIQAAWAYLKRTNQTRQVLAEVLGR